MSNSPLGFQHSLRADFILILVTILAAAGWIFSKEALAGLPPLLFMGMRFLCASFILIVLARRQLVRLSKQQWQAACLVGVLLGLAMSIWVLGLFKTKSLGEGAFITSLSVVLVPVVNWAIFRERPATVTFLALPIAMFGMALLSLRHGFTPEASQVYFFIAALLMSVTFILNSRAAYHIPALALSAIQLFLVGAVTFTLSLFFEAWPTSVSNAVWGWLFLSITVATAGRFFLQTYAQSLTTPSRAAIIMILEPVWTTLGSVFWFNDWMTTTQFIGCGLILLALIINRLKPQPLPFKLFKQKSPIISEHKNVK